MWAGGSITYHTPISVGAQARRHSEIREVRSTSGRTGRLVFVSVHHVISTGDTTCLVEDQNIVYRGEQTAGRPAPSPANDLTTPPDRSDTMRPDSTLLYRYSALTANGHRIHYDHRYATEREGYPDLVVHGPLTATLLQRFAVQCEPETVLIRFDFRGVAPLFVDQPIALEASRGDRPDTLNLRAVNPNGVAGMTATATFTGPVR